MRIAVIRSNYTPFGGAGRTTLSIIQGLLGRGIWVELLTWPAQEWPLGHTKLKIIPLGINKGTRFWRAWTFNRGVEAYLKTSNFDRILSIDRVTRFTHLHAGGGTHKAFLRTKNAESTLAARLFRKLSLFHAYTLHLEKRGFANCMLQKIRCNSSLVKRDILRDYGVDPARLFVLHSSIDWQGMAEVFNNRHETRNLLCQEHKLDPEKEYILFLGSGFKRKGLDLVLTGLAKLPPEFHLIVVGRGIFREYRNLAQGSGIGARVHFLGPQPKGWRYAAVCRGLALPSRYDPFGGAAAEGHAMGLPVLVSDMTGYADWVVHGENGIILQGPLTHERVEDAFQAFLPLLKSPRKSSQEIRAHNRALDNETVTERLMDEFLELPAQTSQK